MQEDNKKLYSLKSIGLAAFLGGPLADSYLIRENFRLIGQHDKANKALIIGIVSTALLFCFIFAVPERIMDKVPNFLMPAVYTPIIHAIAKKIQGDFLKSHEENGNQYFSGWRSAGISLICVLIAVAAIFLVMISFPDKALNKYNQKMTLFIENEENTLSFYENIYPLEDRYKLLDELDSSIIPKWEENITIIEDADEIDGLSKEIHEQNKLLKKYSELRVETFQSIRENIFEDIQIYGDDKIDSLHIEIDLILEKLN